MTRCERLSQPGLYDRGDLHPRDWHDRRHLDVHADRRHVLRSLPVRAEEELFVGWRALPEAGARHWPFTTAGIDLLRRDSRLLESVAGVGYNSPNPITVVDGDEASDIQERRA